jgi:SsrA-binding protein
MKKTKASPPSAVINRRARYDYELGDQLTVGMSLTGPQVRAARDNRVQIQGSFVKVSRDDELYLTGSTFSIRGNGKETVSDTSDIKLLATKRQIRDLIAARQAGSTIVPTKLIRTSRHIKLVIAVGKGKKAYDKRQVIKKRDLERENRIRL